MSNRIFLEWRMDLARVNHRAGKEYYPGDLVVYKHASFQGEGVGVIVAVEKIQSRTYCLVLWVE